MTPLQAHVSNAIDDAAAARVVVFCAHEPHHVVPVARLSEALSVTEMSLRRQITALASFRGGYRHGFPWLHETREGVLLTAQALHYLNNELPPVVPSMTGWMHASPAGRRIMVVTPESHRLTLSRQLRDTMLFDGYLLLVGDGMSDVAEALDDDDRVIWSRYATIPKLSRILQTLPTDLPLRVVATYPSQNLQHICAAWPHPSDLIVVNSSAMAMPEGGVVDSAVIMTPDVCRDTVRRALRVAPSRQRIPPPSWWDTASPESPLVLNGRTY